MKWGMVCLLLTVCVGVQAQQQEEDVESLYLDAVRARNYGDHKLAFMLFRQAAELDSTSADIQYAIAPYYFAQDSIDAGFAALEAAVRLAPDNYWYAEALMKEYADQGQSAKAMELAEKLRQQYPNKPEITDFLLQIYQYAEEYPKVLAILDEKEKANGKSAELTYYRVGVLLRMEEYKRAVKEIKAYIKLFPNNYTMQAFLGETYLNIEKPKDAYKVLQSILKDNPRHPDALLGMIHYYSYMNDIQRYMAAILDVVQDSTIDTQLKAQPLALLANIQSYDSLTVLRVFTDMYAQYPEDSYILAIYAEYLERTGQQDKTAAVLDRLLEIEPDNRRVRLQLLYDAIANRNNADVIRLCEPLTQSMPETNADVIYYYYLASAYIMTDREEEARTLLENIIGYLPADIDPKNASELFGMAGDMWHQAGNDSLAYDRYEVALRYDALNISVLNNYAYYISLEPAGDFARAEAMSRSTIERQPDNATFLDTYAWILYRQKRYAEARKYIDRCFENAETDEINAEVLEHAGDIYRAVGDTDEANKYYQQAIAAGGDVVQLNIKINETK